MQTASRLHRERAGQLHGEASQAVESLRPREAARLLEAHAEELRGLWLAAAERRRWREEFDQLWRRLRVRRAESQAAWQQAQIERLERLLQTRERLAGSLEKVRANRWLNEDRLCEARSESYRERLVEWIQQGEKQEQDLLRSLAGLEKEIRATEERLGRLGGGELPAPAAGGDGQPAEPGEPAETGELAETGEPDEPGELAETGEPDEPGELAGSGEPGEPVAGGQDAEAAKARVAPTVEPSAGRPSGARRRRRRPRRSRAAAPPPEGEPGCDQAPAPVTGSAPAPAPGSAPAPAPDAAPAPAPGAAPCPAPAPAATEPE